MSARAFIFDLPAAPFSRDGLTPVPGADALKTENRVYDLFGYERPYGPESRSLNGIKVSCRVFVAREGDIVIVERGNHTGPWDVVLNGELKPWSARAAYDAATAVDDWISLDASFEDD